MLKRIIQLTRFDRQQLRSTISLLFIIVGFLLLHNLHLLIDQGEEHSYKFAENASLTLSKINPADITLAEQRQVYIPQYKSEEKFKEKGNEDLDKSGSIKDQKIKPFIFDPNTASHDDLVKLGLPNKVSNNIIKYRNAGGQFGSKEDVKKIYGLSQNLYNEIKSYIKIPTREKSHVISKPLVKSESPYQEFTKKNYVHVELNSATAESLQQLPGIGTSYSNRIIKFRKLLGGYANTDQLNEVYGFPDSTFQKIKPYLSVDKELLQKMNIITYPKDSLAKHIYITWKHAKLIKNYMFQHLEIQDVNELYNIKAIDSITMSKIIPYLEIANHDLTTNKQ